MSTLSHYGIRPVLNTKASVSGGESPVTPARVAGGTPQTGSAGRKGVRRARHWRSSVWREQVRSRLADLAIELDSVADKDDPRHEDALQRLNEAFRVIDRKPCLTSAWTGVDIEAAWMRIHAIEVALVRLSTPEVVRAKLPGIIDDGSRLLGDQHPRVKLLRAYQKRSSWSSDGRECLAQSVKAVFEESDKENVRLRSFRNILLGATLALAVLAISFAVFGTINPAAINQLSNPSTSVAAPTQPVTRTEIVVVEMLGLISATLVGAVAIRRIEGTSTVYGVPMASLLLKLPSGALTALAGILMIRAGIVPGVAFTSDTHLGAYALLFGASQQGFTGLVDRQAHNVLSNVSSKDNA